MKVREFLWLNPILRKDLYHPMDKDEKWEEINEKNDMNEIIQYLYNICKNRQGNCGFSPAYNILRICHHVYLVRDPTNLNQQDPKFKDNWDHLFYFADCELSRPIWSSDDMERERFELRTRIEKISQSLV